MKKVSFVLLFFVVGCSFWLTRPETSAQRITIGYIYQVAKVSCRVAAQKWPDDAPAMLSVLEQHIVPGLDDPVSRRAVVLEMESSGLRSGLGFDWRMWIAPALSLARAYAVQEGVLDESATYWEAVKAAVSGCIAGVKSA